MDKKSGQQEAREGGKRRRWAGLKKEQLLHSEATIYCGTVKYGKSFQMKSV